MLFIVPVVSIDEVFELAKLILHVNGFNFSVVKVGALELLAHIREWVFHLLGPGAIVYRGGSRIGRGSRTRHLACRYESEGIEGLDVKMWRDRFRKEGKTVSREGKATWVQFSRNECRSSCF